MTEFTIPYPATPKGKAAWNKQYGLNAYWAGKHWAKRKADADYWHALTRHAIRGLQPAQRKSERKLFRNKTIFGIVIIAKNQEKIKNLLTNIK